MLQRANNRNKIQINVPAKRLCCMMIFHNRLSVQMHRHVFVVCFVLAGVTSGVGNTIHLDGSLGNELPKPFGNSADQEPELPVFFSKFGDDDDDVATDELPSPLVSDIQPETNEETTTIAADMEELFLSPLMGKKMKDNSTTTKTSKRNRNRNRKRNSIVRKAVQAAAEAGLQAMVKLYEKTEPDLLAAGNFLSPDDPGAKLSSFSAPTEGNENAMKSGYAALVTAKKLKER